MGRQYRIFITNLPFLVQLESIDNIEILKEKADFEYLKSLVKELSKKYLLDIHAYCLLKDSIYFLSTPREKESLMRFMQSLARTYTSYFNKKYNRKGTIWAGRYKASLVEDSSNLLNAMVYIESLPKDAKKYPFSSIGKNLFGKDDEIVVEHTIYKELGDEKAQRNFKYLAVFNNRFDNKSLSFIDKCLKKQSVIGSLSFIKRIEHLVGFSLMTKKRGRPKKIQNKGKKMYKNLVVLDKNKHFDLKLKPIVSLDFAKELMYCPIVAKEVELVGELFPIVFSGDKENPALIALLSLGTQNLAINDEGKWIGKYVPSFVRRYPFSLGKTDDDQKIVLIDEDSSLFSKSEGEALFTEEKEQSPTLKRAINFLNAYENENSITNSILKEIIDSDILENREISIQDGDEKRVLVDGFKVVDREKLNNLDDKVLADWVRRGVINFIELHLKSLENIQRLFSLTQEAQQK